MNTVSPYRVSTSNGKIPLLIMDKGDQLPAAFALMGTRAPHKVAVRILGGCKGMTADDKKQMVGIFNAAFDRFQGVVFSGGTRMTRDGEVDPMVTDIPGVIALSNPGCVALGTMPRTSVLTLQEDSRLVLDEYGTVPNPDMHGLLIVQNGPDGSLDWDGDVSIYFALMEQWRDYAGFTNLATIAWNGGAITEQEIKHSLTRGWPTILMKGSGRATDEIVGRLEAGDDPLPGIPSRNNIIVVNKDDPFTLRDTLIGLGIILSPSF